MAEIHAIKALRSLQSLKKIGFMVPSSNTALEPITVSMTNQLGARVSLHFSRVEVTTLDTNQQSVGQFAPNKMLAGAVLLGDAKLDALLWNGTSGSWSGKGLQAEHALAASIEQKTGIAASTSTLAQVEVLEQKGIKRLSLAGPYVDGPMQGLVDFYSGLGYEVLATSQMDETLNTNVGHTPLARIKELIRKCDHPDAECVVVACTNWPAALVVEEMEAELGKPIYDSVCVTLWKALRMVNIEVALHGWVQVLKFLIPNYLEFMNIPSLNFRVLRNPGSFVVVGQAVIEVVVDTTDKGGQKQQLVEV
ncbi:MAG: hypothetical protein LQ347_005325 [Umbilicaria vellea]|nr:MAG: hypothetical protein LQ347_005325 [Umbilicaria vellea]